MLAAKGHVSLRCGRAGLRRWVHFSPTGHACICHGHDGQRGNLGADELRDLVRRQLQDFACQMAVGEPKLIKNSEVISLCDRD